jgi:hypothetical protein
MKTVQLKEASRTLAAYAADLGSESLVIVANRKPVAALVSLKGADRETVALSLSSEFHTIIRRARGEAKRGKVYSLEQVKAELLAEGEASRVAPPARLSRRRDPKARGAGEPKSR